MVRGSGAPTVVVSVLRTLYVLTNYEVLFTHRRALSPAEEDPRKGRSSEEKNRLAHDPALPLLLLRC